MKPQSMPEMAYIWEAAESNQLTHTIKGQINSHIKEVAAITTG